MITQHHHRPYLLDCTLPGEGRDSTSNACNSSNSSSTGKRSGSGSNSCSLSPHPMLAPARRPSTALPCGDLGHRFPCGAPSPSEYVVDESDDINPEEPCKRGGEQTPFGQSDVRLLEERLRRHVDAELQRLVELDCSGAGPGGELGARLADLDRDVAELRAALSALSPAMAAEISLRALTHEVDVQDLKQDVLADTTNTSLLDLRRTINDVQIEQLQAELASLHVIKHEARARYAASELALGDVRDEVVKRREGILCFSGRPGQANGADDAASRRDGATSEAAGGGDHIAKVRLMTERQLNHFTLTMAALTELRRELKAQRGRFGTLQDTMRQSVLELQQEVAEVCEKQEEVFAKYGALQSLDHATLRTVSELKQTLMHALGRLQPEKAGGTRAAAAALASASEEQLPPLPPQLYLARLNGGVPGAPGVVDDGWIRYDV
eukprot:NODE_6625_length_1654_cov_5.042567.p1 GENE.NODE_6625_length_1654_cov_5.042567~~NODE_6625_length_1654_cov_5.042567.p1  ORF type:complete len:439 (-),score=132.50 NODE_6625_length_1654_cov_5.042567:178-1494(-)